MRVMATKQGFYDQILREPGEVFDLLDNPDGTMPIRMKRTDILDADKQPTGDYTEHPWLDENGDAVHADFAEDGYVVKGRGKFRGTELNAGWMRQVSASTPVGIYPEGTVFDSDGGEERKPVARIIKPSNEPVNAPRATAIRGKTERPRRSA